MVDYIEWPASLKHLNATIPYLVDSFSTPGPSLGGQVRGIKSLSARWAYSFTFKIWSRDEHLAWRSFMSNNYGVAGLVRVPICDCKFTPKMTVNGIEKPSPKRIIPYSDSASHSDGAYFADDYTSGLALGASVGAITMDVITDNSIRVIPGHYFSDGERLYTVSSVEPVVDNTIRLTFTPRLRAAIPRQSAVSFKHLFCLMRMSSEDVLNVEAQLGKFATATVTFEEQMT